MTQPTIVFSPLQAGVPVAGLAHWQAISQDEAAQFNQSSHVDYSWPHLLKK